MKMQLKRSNYIVQSSRERHCYSTKWERNSLSNQHLWPLTRFYTIRWYQLLDGQEGRISTDPLGMRYGGTTKSQSIIPFIWQVGHPKEPYIIDWLPLEPYTPKPTFISYLRLPSSPSVRMAPIKEWAPLKGDYWKVFLLSLLSPWGFGRNG